MSFTKIEDEDLGINLLHEAQGHGDRISEGNIDDGNGDGSHRTIDIVAIHGIGAHPLHTWAYWNAETKSVKNWLHDIDMLNQDFPYARILIFGYRSSWKGPQSSDATISEIAINLLHSLKRARQGFVDRPILFIAHCAGGLVLIKALKLAYEQELREDQYRQLFTATIGAIFMGTPFRGAHGALADGAMIKAAQDRINALEGGEQKDEARIIERILDILRPGNESLNNLLDDFLDIESDLMPQLLCIYENQPSNVWKIIGETRQREILVPRPCATLDRVQSRMFDTDHFDLNKMKDRSHERYRMIIYEIKELLREDVFDDYFQQRRNKLITKNPTLHRIRMEQRLRTRTPSSPDVGLKYFRAVPTSGVLIASPKRRRSCDTGNADFTRMMYVNLQRQIERQQPVYFLDALGRLTPFHLEFIRSSEAFKAVLEDNFKDYGPATEMIRNGNFAITDTATGRDVDLSKRWDLIFQPNQAVMMSLIFKVENQTPDNVCPYCSANCSGPTSKDTQCLNCGRVFRRITDVSDSVHPAEQSREIFAEGFSLTSDYRDSDITKTRVKDLMAPSAQKPDGEKDILRDIIPMFRNIRIVSKSVSRSPKVWCEVQAWVWYYNDNPKEKRAGWCYVENGDTVIVDSAHDSKIALFCRLIADLDAKDDGFDMDGGPRFTWREGYDTGGWVFTFNSVEDKETIRDHIRKAPSFKSFSLNRSESNKDLRKPTNNPPFLPFLAKLLRR